MLAPKTRPIGSTVAADGDVTLFEAKEIADKSWFDRGRRVIYVNGMDNQPKHHVEGATALSLLQCCPTIGIYNKTDGFWSDLGQCIKDKATLVGVQANIGLTFDGWSTVVDQLFQAAKGRNPALNKVAFVGSLIASNKATAALYGLIAGAGGLERPAIYCHSQGNLITSNALTAVALAKGPGAVVGIEVNSFGSPCRYWPPPAPAAHQLCLHLRSDQLA